MTTKSTAHAVFDRAKRQPGRPAYYVRKSGSWRPTTWSDYGAQVRTAARALCALGVEPGNTVSILGFNRPEWTIVDVATIAIGGAPAGVYTTCSAEEIQYIVSHAASPVMLVETEEQWKKVESKLSEMPDLRHVVMMQGAPKIEHDKVLSWDEFNAKAEETDDSVIDDRMAALEPDGLATLIYTSGTTGPPKGVMLSNDNLVWTANLALGLVEMTDDDCALSYLPLSHIAEQMFTVHGPAQTGAAVYYAESIDKVADNLKEVQPTVFFGVPRIWEKFYTGITGKLADATGVKKALVDWTRNVCTERTRARNAGGQPGALNNAQYWLANKILLSKLKPAIGLGRCKVAVSGAAPISREILEFFASLDIVVHEVYGQSEDTGPTSFNIPGRTRYGTVGPALPGVEVKIADDGEICVKGRNVFLGYYKDEEATNATLQDGWLHSGDLGEFDKDGFLSITGRKKDIIITAGGKNVAPKNIEAALKNHNLINEAVVIGDRRKYLTALITIDEEAYADFAAKNGLNGKPASDSDEVRNEVQRTVDEINKTLAKVETIKKFTILERNLTVEHGELTPTLKVKRNKVSEIWADTIDAMYG